MREGQFAMRERQIAHKRKKNKAKRKEKDRMCERGGQTGRREERASPRIKEG